VRGCNKTCVLAGVFVDAVEKEADKKMEKRKLGVPACIEKRSQQ